MLITKKESLTKIAETIRAKTNKSEALSYPDGFIDEINSIKGGEVVEKKNVNFYDYDGTLLYSYTAEETNALTELPELPVHAEFKNGAWSVSSVDEIKNKNAATVSFLPDADGALFLTVDIEDIARQYVLRLSASDDETGTVDWGDGTVDTIKSTTHPGHYYTKGGTYLITLKLKNTITVDTVTKYNLGIFSGDDYSFIPASTVRAIIINTAISNNSRYFYNFSNLKYVWLSKKITSIGSNAFQGCASLESINTENVTTIGAYAFHGCASLESINTENVTTIGTDAFYGCASLESINTENVTTIDASAFQGCASLESINTENVTTIDTDAFQGCFLLQNLTFSGNIASISARTCLRCQSLTSVEILGDISKINEQAFFCCYNLKSLSLLNVSAVPTLANTSAIPQNSGLKIYVPAALLEDFKAATNWSTYADYFVGV